MEQYCEEEGLQIFMQIPLEREIGQGIAQGKSLLEIKPEYEKRFQQLHLQISEALSIVDRS